MPNYSPKPSYNQVTSWNRLIAVCALFGTAGIYFALHHHPLFHLSLDFIITLTSLIIFIIAFNTFHLVQNQYFLFLGVAYGCAGFFELLHTLTTQGIVVTGLPLTNLSLQLHLAGMMMLTGGLVFAPYQFIRPAKVIHVYAAFFTITLLQMCTIFFHPVFPICYDLQRGYTPFTIVTGIAITLCLVWAFIATFRQRRRLHNKVLTLLLLSIACLCVSEGVLLYYFYFNGTSDMISHLLKLLACYLAYKVIVETSLAEPQNLLYYQYSQSQQELQLLNEQLKEEITDHRNSAKRLQRSLEQLTHTQTVLQHREKLALIGQMSAGMAHEIKNPLTTIRGFAQLLHMRCHNDIELCDYVSIMMQEVDQASHIIDDFLELARPKPPQLQPQSIPMLLNEILALVDPQAFLKSITVNYQQLCELPLCLLDKNQIKQVVLNICKNALEAMPTGGTLTLTCGVQDKEIFIDVIDTGCGISEEQLQNVGVPFFTTKSTGTGLGLSICFAIVHNHNGRIQIESQQDIGSRFRILLPSSNPCTVEPNCEA